MFDPGKCKGITINDRFRLGRLLTQGSTGYVFEAVGREYPAASEAPARSQPPPRKSHPWHLFVVPSERLVGPAGAKLPGIWQSWLEQPHPALCPCCEAGRIETGELAGGLFAVAAAAGQTLAQRLAGGLRPTYEEAAALLRQIAGALDFLHARGISHGCVCRSNVFLEEEGWQLGLGAAGESGTFGTEQGGPAADVFALGLMVAGSLVDQLAWACPDSRVVPAEEVAPVPTAALETIDDPLRVLLQRCLDVDPAARPTAALLAQAAEPMPEGVHDIRVERQGTTCRLTWPPPAHGKVLWYGRSIGEPLEPLPVLLASDLDDLGELLSAEAENAMSVDVPENGYRVVLPVTSNGVVAVAGKPVVIGSLADTTLASSAIDRGDIVARFHWPAGVDHAVVALREDGFPTGPDDPRAVRVPFSRAAARLGPFRNPVRFWEQLYLTVHSAENRGDHWEYSPGLSLEARCHVDVSQYRRICYRIRPRRLTTFLSRTYELEIRTDTVAALPGLVLIGKPGRTMPRSRRDGEELLILNEGYECGPDATVKEFFDGLDRPFGVALFAAESKLDPWLQFDYCSKVIFT